MESIAQTDYKSPAINGIKFDIIRRKDEYHPNPMICGSSSYKREFLAWGSPPCEQLGA